MDTGVKIGARGVMSYRETRRKGKDREGSSALYKQNDLSHACAAWGNGVTKQNTTVYVATDKPNSLPLYQFLCIFIGRGGGLPSCILLTDLSILMLSSRVRRLCAFIC